MAINTTRQVTEALKSTGYFRFGPGRHWVQGLVVPPRAVIECHPKALISNRGEPTIHTSSATYGVRVRGGHWTGKGPLWLHDGDQSLSQSVFSDMLVDTWTGWDLIGTVSNTWRDVECRCKIGAYRFDEDRQANFNAWDRGSIRLSDEYGIEIHRGTGNQIVSVQLEDLGSMAVKLHRQARQTTVERCHIESTGPVSIQRTDDTELINNYFSATAGEVTNV